MSAMFSPSVCFPLTCWREEAQHGLTSHTGLSSPHGTDHPKAIMTAHTSLPFAGGAVGPQLFVHHVCAAYTWFCPTPCDLVHAPGCIWPACKAVRGRTRWL